jgi:hypothetical protein
MHEHHTEVNYADSDYLALFRPEIRNDLFVEKTFLCIDRNPISIFRYKKEYIIGVCKIDLKSETPLPQVLSEKKKAAYISDDMSNTWTALPYGTGLGYIWRKQPDVEQIQLNHDENLAWTIKNDSVYSCLLQAGILSLQYDSLRPVDISFGYGGREKLLWFDINFWRKKHSVYFILLYKILPPRLIESDLLHSFLQYQ